MMNFHPLFIPNNTLVAQVDWQTLWPTEWLPQTAFGAAAATLLLSVLLFLLRRGGSPSSLQPVGVLAYLCLFCGVAATSLIVTHTVTEAFVRMMQPYAAGPANTAAPFTAILCLLLVACAIGGRATRTHLAPGWFLALFALLALHLSVSYGAPATTLRNPATLISSDAVPKPWTLWFQIAIAALLTTGAIAQDLVFRKRRAAAWPDRLDLLLSRYLDWPGFATVEAVLAAGVLVLGVYHVVLADTQATGPAALNGLAALAAGLTCLFMAYRRWNGNTAMLGMTLLSLALILVAITIAGLFIIDVRATAYVQRMPTLLNVVLYALWVVVALWLWLGVFWDQQLLNGQGWTTTGKMIPYANSLALYLLLIGVICAFQMTIWTVNPGTPPDQLSLAKLIVGAGGIFVLMIPALRIGLAKQNVAFASVACVLAAALFAYLALRWPQPGVRGFLKQYAPVLIGVGCLFLLLIAEALDRKKTGHAFAAPIWFLSLLFLPVLAISNLMTTNRLAESWIQAGTLLPLAVTYTVAGLREHRRSFVVLAAVLLVAAFST